MPEGALGRRRVARKHLDSTEHPAAVVRERVDLPDLLVRRRRLGDVDARFVEAAVDSLETAHEAEHVRPPGAVGRLVEQLFAALERLGERESARKRGRRPSSARQPEADQPERR